jgi:hypothetical protein
MKKRALITLMLIGILGACSNPRSDLTSPCVGAEGSPCGPRRPVNDWWLKDAQQGEQG